MNEGYRDFLAALDPRMAKLGVKGVIAVIRAECGAEAIPATVPADKRAVVLEKIDAAIAAKG